MKSVPMPSSPSASGTVRCTTPSTCPVPPVSVPDSLVASVVDGSVVEGSVVDGSVVDGSVLDAVLEGSVLDGSVLDGSVLAPLEVSLPVSSSSSSIIGQPASSGSDTSARESAEKPP